MFNEVGFELKRDGFMNIDFFTEQRTEAPAHIHR